MGVVSRGRGTSNTFACITMMNPKRVLSLAEKTFARTGSRDSFSANAETIAVGTELALLELGTGALGSDKTLKTL